MMAPLEQENELREKVDSFVDGITVLIPYTRVTKEAKRRLYDLIKQDREEAIQEALKKERNGRSS